MVPTCQAASITCAAKPGAQLYMQLADTPANGGWGLANLPPSGSSTAFGVTLPNATTATLRVCAKTSGGTACAAPVTAHSSPAACGASGGTGLCTPVNGVLVCPPAGGSGSGPAT